MPFSIQLRPSELRVHGELESTELDNKEMLNVDAVVLASTVPARTRKGHAAGHSVHERLCGTVPSLKPPQGHGTDPNVHIGLLKEAGTGAQTLLGGWPKEPPDVQDPLRGPGQPRTSCLHDSGAGNDPGLQKHRRPGKHQHERPHRVEPVQPQAHVQHQSVEEVLERNGP